MWRRTWAEGKRSPHSMRPMWDEDTPELLASFLSVSPERSLCCLIILPRFWLLPSLFLSTFVSSLAWLGLSSGTGPLAAAQDGLHSGYQLGLAYRFCQVEVGAGVYRSYPAPGTGYGAQHENRNVNCPA